MTKTRFCYQQDGRLRAETWVRETLCCPGCGKKEVWMKDDGGDFYVGESYRCAACHAYFTIQYSGPDVGEPCKVELARMAAMKPEEQAA